MHQIISVATIPAAIPTAIQIPHDVFWKLNINKATKNPQALFSTNQPYTKGQILGGEITYDHISRA